MLKGEKYLISKEIISQVSESLTTMFAEELKVIKKNQADHQAKYDAAFEKIENRGISIDLAIPKISEMYDSICGNEKLGMKGYNERVSKIEDRQNKQDSLNNKFIGAMWMIGIVGGSGWIGFIWALLKLR
jgi:hypothetical protein